MEFEHYIDGQHNGGVFNSGNLNTYGYCYQNPVLYVDPNGKQAEFWKGAKDGFVGTFKAGYKLVTEPVKTVKSAVNNYSWKDYGEGVANTVTAGAYELGKGAYKSATGDQYGAGEIAGKKAAEAAIVVATEGAGKVISSAKGATKTTTVYRGVNSTAGEAYENALQGVAKSRGGSSGHTDVLKHNTSVDGTINSSYTSWTTDIEVGLNYAYRTSGEGVLLQKNVPTSSIIKSPNLKSVNLIQTPGTIVSESEVLLKGTVKNASVKQVKLN